MIEFDPHINAHNSQIILVGCGGTGSSLASIIGRTIYHMKALGIDTPQRIAFIDPDIIEQKNVGRQAFLPAHIGQYKAEILATRLNLALGLDIEHYCEALDINKHLDIYQNKSIIILGAVDNYQARQEISKVEDAIWIDSGNDKENGQVVIGNSSKEQDVKRILNSRDETSKSLLKLPNAALVFPDLLEAPAQEKPQIVEDDLSCAELLRRGDQHLLINSMMANVAGNYLYNLLMRVPIYTHYTYVGLHAMRSEPITIKHLKQYVQ